MAVLNCTICMKSFIFFTWVYVIWFIAADSIKPLTAQAPQSLVSCDTNSTEASGYRCNANREQNQCSTFALFYANSYYYSLSDLSYYFGFNRTGIAEASNLSSGTEFLWRNQPVLIPIPCNCNGSFYQAKVIKTASQGETFSQIASSLEGLTTCKAIRENNPSLSSWFLESRIEVQVPLRCSCPSFAQISKGTRFLVSYPVQQGDTVHNLASAFNVSIEAIASVNNRSSAGFNSGNLVLNSTLLIPLQNKPFISLILKTREPKLNLTPSNTPLSIAEKSQKRDSMCKIGVYIAVSGVAVLASLATTATILAFQWRRKKLGVCKTEDLELQQWTDETPLDLAEILEDLQDNSTTQTTGTVQKMAVVNTFTLDELRRATDDFSSSNLIEGSVYHGWLNGSNLAIKQVKLETITDIDFKLLSSTRHRNLVQLLGACRGESCNSYLVFEYAKNGSLKDWLHGGLAIKNQFIASCYCFLTWKQRLRISLHVATGLKYMHCESKPSYVHKHIKSKNILLDEDFNAKIAKFGMADCVHGDFFSSEPVSWAKGYLAPEFLKHGTVDPNIDIFAYGVVLLEILSGRTPISKVTKNGESVLLSEQIKLVMDSGSEVELKDWMDNSLGDCYSFNAALNLAKLARACVEDDPSVRPSAEEIVKKLGSMVEDLPEGELISRYGSSCRAQVMAV